MKCCGVRFNLLIDSSGTGDDPFIRQKNSTTNVSGASLQGQLPGPRVSLSFSAANYVGQVTIAGETLATNC